MFLDGSGHLCSQVQSPNTVCGNNSPGGWPYGKPPPGQVSPLSILGPENTDPYNVLSCIDRVDPIRVMNRRLASVAAISAGLFRRHYCLLR